MQIPSISTLANQNRNSFKGFNNVLALRVTTDNGNSVKVFSCKLNNIGFYYFKSEALFIASLLLHEYI